MNGRTKWLLALLTAFVLAFAATPAVQPLLAKPAGKKDTVCLSPEMVRLQGDMRKGWIDHTIWTRSYIFSAISNRPDQKDVLDRLLRNQQEIGN
jgi:hypothetical protein